jgi:hypothetical protein
MAFSEDVSLFFADFGETATWKGSTSITVIFDNAYQLAYGLVEGTNPVILAKAADVPGVAQGDAISLRSVNYTIADIEPDGTGMTVLRLK